MVLKISYEDKKLLKTIISSTIVNEINLKIIQSLNDSEDKEIQKLKETSQDKLEESLENLINNSPKVRKVIENYFQTELPERMMELINSYLSVCSPEEKEKNLALLGKYYSVKV